MQNPNRRHARKLRIERLEDRSMMTAEGQAYNFDRIVDTSDLFGTISGSIGWGDGTNSGATIQSAPTIGPIKFRFDYSLDTAGFFGCQSPGHLANRRRLGFK